MSANTDETGDTSSVVPGWDRYVDGLRRLPDRMLAKMPGGVRDDPLIRHETGWLALTAAAKKTFEMLGQDGEAPMFMPTLNIVLRSGQPNPDINYRSAIIAPGGTYRMTGRRGSLHYFLVTQQIPPADRTFEDSSYDGSTGGPEINMATVRVDADDRYDLLISPEKPDDYDGDWWQLDPRCNCLLVRLLAADWDREIDPTLSIERVDVPIGLGRRATVMGEKLLNDLPAIISASAMRFAGRLQEYRSQGWINRVNPVALIMARGSGNHYYEGSYELAPDEGLLYVSEVPANCGYRSILVTNGVYETIDWYNHQSCLNHAQAPLDSDGKLRLVISAQDPGIPNWLDTAGNPMGMIQGRWWAADSCPVPVLTRIRLADLRKHLPADTPRISFDERQAVLRQRRRALMQRSIW